MAPEKDMRNNDDNTALRHRKIVHVDMDAFFASVEQRDHPELRGKPVAVGGIKERGVVAAASYEARKFGVRSAMPSVIASRKCPELVFVKPRFDVYRAVSQQIREIFAEYTPLIEPLSLDEAYLDVTENLKGIQWATEVAKEIRAKIFAITGLTASAGISYNKFLAKMASDQRKPNGQFSIPPGRGEDFIAQLRIASFHGVGPATEQKMERLGIATGADLKTKSLEFLQQNFGKSGLYFYNLARAIDHREVQPDRERKSIGAENTFMKDILSIDEAREHLFPIVEKVARHCREKEKQGRTVTLKVKYHDFEQITRARTFTKPVSAAAEILEIVETLLPAIFPPPKPVRLLGVTLSGLDGERSDENMQMSLV